MIVLLTVRVCSCEGLRVLGGPRVLGGLRVLGGPRGVVVCIDVLVCVRCGGIVVCRILVRALVQRLVMVWYSLQILGARIGRLESMCLSGRRWRLDLVICLMTNLRMSWLENCMCICVLMMVEVSRLVGIVQLKGWLRRGKVMLMMICVIGRLIVSI